MKAWLAEQGLADAIPREQTRRAFLAFSRCPFGEQVTTSQRRTFFRLLAPWVHHLAIQPLDMGRFHDPKYALDLYLRDVTPIC